MVINRDGYKLQFGGLVQFTVAPVQMFCRCCALPSLVSSVCPLILHASFSPPRLSGWPLEEAGERSVCCDLWVGQLCWRTRVGGSALWPRNIGGGGTPDWAKLLNCSFFPPLVTNQVKSKYLLNTNFKSVYPLCGSIHEGKLLCSWSQVPWHAGL